MLDRQNLLDTLALETAQFQTRVADLHPSAAARLDRVNAPAAFDGPEEFPAFETLGEHEQDLVWRLWVLDEIPFGLALSGPAFQDNPILYTNQTFREMTGYSLADVREENLRLLQGPETEDAPVADLREALDIWAAVTVELWNYRRDGTRFRNRVSLVPINGPSGAIANWIGVQEVIDSEAE